MSGTSTDRTLKSCTLCEKLIAALHEVLENHLHLNLGRFDVLRALECDTHGPLLDWLAEWFSGLDITQALHFRRDYWSSSFTFYLGEHYDETSPELDVTESDDQNQFTGCGVEVDQDWIDDKTLIQWYKSCGDGHDGCRGAPYVGLLPAPEPKYFIDTARNCLSPAPPDSSYVVLSYVWGQADVIKVLTSSLAQLQRPGALEGPETSLPAKDGQARLLPSEAPRRALSLGRQRLHRPGR